MTSSNIIRLAPQPDGSFVDWGRHWGLPGSCGPVRLYIGEAAEVMKLVLKHMEK